MTIDGSEKRKARLNGVGRRQKEFSSQQHDETIYVTNSQKTTDAPSVCFMPNNHSLQVTRHHHERCYSRDSARIIPPDGIRRSGECCEWAVIGSEMQRNGERREFSEATSVELLGKEVLQVTRSNAGTVRREREERSRTFRDLIYCGVFMKKNRSIAQKYPKMKRKSFKK